MRQHCNEQLAKSLLNNECSPPPHIVVARKLKNVESLVIRGTLGLIHIAHLEMRPAYRPLKGIVQNIQYANASWLGWCNVKDQSAQR